MQASVSVRRHNCGYSEYVVSALDARGTLCTTVHRFRHFRALHRSIRSSIVLNKSLGRSLEVCMWHKFLLPECKRRLRTRILNQYFGSLGDFLRESSISPPPALVAFLGFGTHESSNVSGSSANKSSGSSFAAGFDQSASSVFGQVPVAVQVASLEAHISCLEAHISTQALMLREASDASYMIQEALAGAKFDLSNLEDCQEIDVKKVTPKEVDLHDAFCAQNAILQRVESASRILNDALHGVLTGTSDPRINISASRNKNSAPRINSCVPPRSSQRSSPVVVHGLRPKLASSSDCNLNPPTKRAWEKKRLFDVPRPLLPRWKSLEAIKPSSIVAKALEPLFYRVDVSFEGANELILENAQIRVSMVEWLLYESLGGVSLPMHIRWCRAKRIRVDLRQLVHRKLPMHISELSIVLSAHRRCNEQERALNEAIAARAVAALLAMTGRRTSAECGGAEYEYYERGADYSTPMLDRAGTTDAPTHLKSRFAPQRNDLGSTLRAALAADRAKKMSLGLGAFGRKRRELLDLVGKQLLPQIHVDFLKIRHEAIGRVAVPHHPVALGMNLADIILLWLLLAHPHLAPSSPLLRKGACEI